MNIASRWMVVLGLAVTLPILAPGQRAAAQEVQVTGPLAGAPAVRKMRVYRDGRFQIRAGAGFTMQDEFVRHIMVTGQAQYHFLDYLGVGVFGAYTLKPLSTKGLTRQIEANGITTDDNVLSLPSAEGFADGCRFGDGVGSASCKGQVGVIDYLVGAQLTFIPLRGKLALFQALFVDTDFYIFAGALAAGLSERSDAVPGGGDDGATCSESFMAGSPDSGACVRSQGARSSRTAIAPTFGAGLSVYFSDYAALTLEWRAFPFKWNNSGTDQAGLNSNRQSRSGGTFPDGEIDKNDRLSQFNQMMNLNVSFLFPTKAKVSE